MVYLIALVTVKAVRLGFHLEFHWFDTTEFYVPGKPPADFYAALVCYFSCSNVDEPSSNILTSCSPSILIPAHKVVLHSDQIKFMLLFDIYSLYLLLRFLHQCDDIFQISIKFCELARKRYSCLGIYYPLFISQLTS